MREETASRTLPNILLAPRLEADARRLLERLRVDGGVHADRNWWQPLTDREQKLLTYVLEAYVREAWRDCVGLWGRSPLQKLGRMCPVLFRPDALATRRVEEALAVLRDLGFEARVTQIVRQSRLTVRELWRYQWNASTLDGIDLLAEINLSGPSLLVLFEYLDSPVSGLARLQQIKGSARHEDRDPASLRARLGSPNSHFLLLHAPDEPVDVLREAGILFSRDERRELWASFDENARGGTVAPTRAALEVLYAETAHNTLAVRASVDAIALALGHRPARIPSRRRAALTALRAGEQAEPIGWSTLVEGLGPAKDYIPVWDLLVVASALTVEALPDVERIIGR